MQGHIISTLEVIHQTIQLHRCILMILKRFLQIGTSELYGSNNFAVNEEHPVNPTSPYAVSKLAADLHLESLFNTMKFPMSIIRPSNCYSSGQYMYRIVPRAIYCGLKKLKFPGIIELFREKQNVTL